MLCYVMLRYFLQSFFISSLLFPNIFVTFHSQSIEQGMRSLASDWVGILSKIWNKLTRLIQ